MGRGIRPTSVSPVTQTRRSIPTNGRPRGRADSQLTKSNRSYLRGSSVRTPSAPEAAALCLWIIRGIATSVAIRAVIVNVFIGSDSNSRSSIEGQEQLPAYRRAVRYREPALHIHLLQQHHLKELPL